MSLPPRNPNQMYVIKRLGNTEPVNIGKVQSRLEYLSQNPFPLSINVPELALAVANRLRNDIRTTDIDTFASSMAASMSAAHPDYGTLASRIAISNHHKNTLESFKDKVTRLNARYVNGESQPLVTTEFYKFVMKHHARLSSMIQYEKDYMLDFFGFKRMEIQYLLRVDDVVVERPQDLFMRVAVCLHMPPPGVKATDAVFSKIQEMYTNLSDMVYTHATPTMFNACTPYGNLSSCYVLGTEDSLLAIGKLSTDAMLISKSGGGVGIHVSNWRAVGSLIRGTNGPSSGIVPFLKYLESSALCANQGGKRRGSFAVYLEPHHPEIMTFLTLRKNGGDEQSRTPDLFLAVWLSDLFMRRVENNENWSLFCPDKCPGLNDVFGEEYERLYLEYETKGMASFSVPARKVNDVIFDSQKESGMPYVMYKDKINRCNMQRNLGIIRSSNLCSEIILYSDSKQYSVCNLASICLPKFVNHPTPDECDYDFERLAKITSDLVHNLNIVIDINGNPVCESARSNFLHRPIGIGIQGLADVFMEFRVAFDSDKAKELNKKISETMYFAALDASCLVAQSIYEDAVNLIEKTGKYLHRVFPKQVLSKFPELKKDDVKVEYTSVEELPLTIGAYPSFTWSGPNDTNAPLRDGIFHWELYGLDASQLSGMHDWESLRLRILKYGVRNSTLIALMPTASTSHIMGNSQCFEPYFSNIFERKTLAGPYIVVNKFLIKELQEMGIWSEKTKNLIVAANGSVQHIEDIPLYVRDVYRTVWEIKQKSIIDMAADRQPFVDQSQSMNLYVEDYTLAKFTSIQNYCWKRGLKTGNYYIHTRPAISAQKVTVDPTVLSQVNMKKESAEPRVCRKRRVGDDECVACSS